MRNDSIFKLVIILVVCVFVVGCSSAKEGWEDGRTAAEEQSLEEQPAATREAEIERAIKIRIDEGNYNNTELDRIVINKDFGSESPEENYIALVYLIFDIKNTRDTGNEVMRMYSDDLVATLANQGTDDISEAAIFWKDDYNSRNVKYAYEYKNGGFFIADVAGE